MANSCNHRGCKIKSSTCPMGPTLLALLLESVMSKVSIMSVTSNISVYCNEPSFHSWENVILLHFHGIFSENSFSMRKCSVNNQKVFKKMELFF